MESGASQASHDKSVRKNDDWSEDITKNIKSPEEAIIYRNAGLKEAVVGGKKALINDNINPSYRDNKGRTNEQRIRSGLSPLSNEGETMYIHHIGQKSDSPFAELTFAQHRQNGNDAILHDKGKPTEVHNENSNWNTERVSYWRERFKLFLFGKGD